MYTIRGVSQLLGVPPTTLRAWEQRYGVIRPARSEGGYRHYDEADLATLQEMARLVATGMQPSLAADSVRAKQSSRIADPGTPAEAAWGLPSTRSLVAAAVRELHEQVQPPAAHRRWGRDEHDVRAGHVHAVEQRDRGALIDVEQLRLDGDRRDAAAVSAALGARPTD